MQFADPDYDFWVSVSVKLWKSKTMFSQTAHCTLLPLTGVTFASHYAPCIILCFNEHTTKASFNVFICLFYRSIKYRNCIPRGSVKLPLGYKTAWKKKLRSYKAQHWIEHFLFCKSSDYIITKSRKWIIGCSTKSTIPFLLQLLASNITQSSKQINFRMQTASLRVIAGKNCL